MSKPKRFQNGGGLLKKFPLTSKTMQGSPIVQDNTSYTRPAVNADTVEQAAEKDFIGAWTRSPMHLSMLKKSAPKDYKGILQGRKNNLVNIPIEYRPQEENPTANATSNNDTGLITIYNRDPAYRQGLMTHEKSHSSDRPIKNASWLMKNLKYNAYLTDDPGYERAIPKSDTDLINKYRPHSFEELPDKEKMEKEFGAYNDQEKSIIFGKRNADYISDPSETRARLNDVRQRAFLNKIYNPLKEPINQQQFKNLIEDRSQQNRGGTDPLRDLKSIYTDDQIINMLNTISSTSEPSNNNALV